MTDWLLRNILPFVLLVGTVHWLLRPRFGKLGVVELFLTNVLGDLVAHAAFEVDHPLVAGLGSILLWLVLAAVLQLLAGRSRRWRPFIGYFAEPVEVVTNGKPDPAAMRRVRISLGEVETALRQHGVRGLSEARSVVVEPDGALSVQQAKESAAELQRLAAALEELTVQVKALQQRVPRPLL